MKILAIDTTTKFLCLGIYDGAKTYEYNLEVGPKLSSLLAVTIKRALEALNFDVQAIDYFVCGLGPGSFTGMRVGLSTIKGLAWVTNKPVIGIPTLDILAKNVDINDRLIIPVIDAKRSLIYCSVYKKQGAKLSRITPYLLITKNELFKKI
ncbi:MAG: tRNA (adenosine(37)-N6)-threonylcarbamoyltransferase complex dimerization subunit type 1 TsaB, partial [Candidatus Omnitrophica bacterium]|nr:tRNA (adenosine(37)-N6)-threonylcarbamoyltransferase complex dimerization subunit type 1 TsaB [Candidatus Omnitrophota bacterium]